jgi:hypothetical protein
MMKNAQQFLEMVTKRFPPLARHHHSLVLHKGKLQLNLVTVAPCWKFVFDEADLEKPAAELVTEIARLLPPRESGPRVA